MKNLSQPDRGLSTIEVIFSILLIATALVVYAASLNLVRLLKTTKYQNISYHIAQKHLEDLRNTDFASLPASGAFSDAQLTLLPAGSAQRTVTDINSSLKQVNVTVSWNEANLTKSISMDTLIYEAGINSL